MADRFFPKLVECWWGCKRSQGLYHGGEIDPGGGASHVGLPKLVDENNRTLLAPKTIGQIGNRWGKLDRGQEVGCNEDN
jgi:hypothetical protein